VAEPGKIRSIDVDADDKSSSGLATLDAILGGGFARQRRHRIEGAPDSRMQVNEPLYTGPRTLLKTDS
jgi:hypothetical protein